MGILEERVKLSLLVNGNGLADNYKNNCLHLMDKITKSDAQINRTLNSFIEIKFALNKLYLRPK